MPSTIPFAASFALVVGACGGISKPPGAADAGVDASVDCVDGDHDGYGRGADCRGEDCDDADPDVTGPCDCGPDGRAHAFGCLCDTVEPEVCFDGDPDTASNGECRTGLRTCRGGAWSSCEGQVLPLDAELCNTLDDDCDRQVDEGVLNACGDCSEVCLAIEWGGPEGTPFDPGPDNSSGVVATDDGSLTLSGDVLTTHLIWIANSVDGTISKVDTRTHEELARYRTGPLGSSVGMWSGDGDNPSRTSVNYVGDAYVANRAFTGIASATKILANDCPDSNGDGVVTTSGGGDDVLAWGHDECVVWNTPAGDVGQLGRSIAAQVRRELDGGLHEYVWLGLHTAHEYVEIDGDTGELTGVEANLADHTPYGAAIDADGNLWSASLSNNIARFDTSDPADHELIPASFNYGITVDSLGNVWTNGDRVRRYRPADREWDEVAGTAYENGGIAVDPNGFVWTHHDSGLVQRIDSTVDPPELQASLQTGLGGRGVAVDSDGFIWVINWGQTAGSLGGPGNVTVIDPGQPDDFDTTCCDRINNSYTYSDMTGVQLGLATARSGRYEVTAEGCEAPASTSWARIELDADVPEGTSVHVEARTAETLLELGRARWIVVGDLPADASPLHLLGAFEEAGSEPAHFLGLRLTLASFEQGAIPVLHRVAVRYSCWQEP